MASSSDSDAMEIDRDETTMDRPLLKERVSLDKMPLEIFSMIMGYLGPVWIYNVSHVCQYTRGALSYLGGGNRIWYDALPPAVWTEPAYHQTIQNQQEKVQLLSARAQNENNDDNLGTAPTTPTTPMPPTSVASDATVPSTVVQAGDAANTTRVEVVQVFPRNRVLGGPYKPLCNYSREIIGRFIQHERCYLCLRVQNDRIGTKVTLIKRWGVLWCQDCRTFFIITAAELLRLLGPSGLMVPWMSAMSVDNAKELFFIPAIEEQLLKIGYPSLQAMETRVAVVHPQVVIETLLTQPLEPTLRYIRCVIVQVAMLVWEGGDVAAFLKAERFLVRVQKNSETYKRDPLLYMFFRETWAPTNKLHEFLFPRHRLLQTPTVQDHESGTWLKDPSRELLDSVHGRLANLQPSQIVKAAREMLDRLVATDYTKYVDRSIGRTVTNWSKAATAFHRARITAEVHNGEIINQKGTDHFGPHRHRFHALHELRIKLGLQRQGTTAPLAMPRRLTVRHLEEMTQENFVEKDKKLKDRLQQYKEAAGHFNRIVLACWKFCPKSGGLIHPGLDGFLEHMESNHPELFYLSDRFNFTRC